MKVTAIPKQQWPYSPGKPPEHVYYLEGDYFDDYLVQVINDKGYVRLTINRTQHTEGQWLDGISWDQLQAIKDALGFQDTWAVEIYPPKDEIVNVANMRHLWLLHEPPIYGWHKK